jgi:hypothetical protein
MTGITGPMRINSSGSMLSVMSFVPVNAIRKKHRIERRC